MSKKLKPKSEPVKGKEKVNDHEIVKTDGETDSAVRPTKPPKI